MAPLSIYEKSTGLALAQDLYSSFSSRVDVSAMTACPVEFTAAYVRFAGAQSCGKCTPCRVGLAQLADLIEKVLDGTADKNTLKLISELAEDIYLSSDCAIGFEAGAFVLRTVKGFADDFLYHVEHHDCGADKFAAIPCVEGCPAHVDIPAYLALVAEHRFDDALGVIRKDNPFALACGLVCEHPCELYCRRGMVDDPLNIRGIKRFAVDHARAEKLPEKAEPTGKSVAIVGGGATGITAAYYLALMGHSPVIYEQRAQLGGMLRYGIPSYRFPREDLDREIALLTSVGVSVELNVQVLGALDGAEAAGADTRVIPLSELRSNHDTVYLSIGAHGENRLGIEGEEAEGVLSAVQLLRAIGDGDLPDFTGKRVMVVGGGNVAMDCARTSIRLGAKHVQIAYRRRRLDMTAQEAEIEAAIAEGCELLELQKPLEVVTSDGKASGLRVKQQIISGIRDGRANPIDSELDDTVLPCDIIIVAIGQKIEAESFASEGLPVQRGRLVAQSDASVPGNDGLFVGGDCVSGPATVILAVAAGKAAAFNIDEWLGYKHEISVDIEIPRAQFATRVYCARSNMVEPHVDNLSTNFDLVERGLLHEEALQESKRCLRCDYFGLSKLRGGRS